MKTAETDGTIIEFLLGSHPYDGVWFGDQHPEKEGWFWWRKALRDYASHPSPMSAEQVEELGYYYPLFKFFSDEHGLSLLDSQLQDVIHECKKFIEPASPSVKADVVKTPHPDKPFIVANVRDIIEGFEMRGDYSYSRMTEMFNDATFQWMGKQELVKADGWVRFEDKKPDTGKLILVSWPSDITPEIRRLTEDDLKDDWSDMKWIYIPEWLPAPPKQQ